VSTLWTSLSTREGVAALVLRQAVSESLEGELRQWVYRNVSRLSDEGQRLMIRLDLAVSDAYVRDYSREYARYEEKVRERAQQIKAEAAAQRAAAEAPALNGGEESQITSLAPYSFAASRYPYPTAPPDPKVRFLAFGTPTELLLDIVDGLLDLLPYKPAPPATNDPVLILVRRARKAMRNRGQRELLQELLDDGHMVYRVRSDGRGLERRMSPVAHAQAIIAADAAEQAGYPIAGERLLAAWNSIYALNPDPSGAYRDAVRAVEAVACPFFLPNAPAPTLGQVIRHLEDRASGYEMVIADKTGQPADVGAAIAMMRLVWDGHRDRHEGGRTSAPISRESADAAVAVAITLVQLVSTASIRAVRSIGSSPA
jgi:hypothetical protein